MAMEKEPGTLIKQFFPQFLDNKRWIKNFSFLFFLFFELNK
jgi:hypothetical protein